MGICVSITNLGWRNINSRAGRDARGLEKADKFLLDNLSGVKRVCKNIRRKAGGSRRSVKRDTVRDLKCLNYHKCGPSILFAEWLHLPFVQLVSQ